MLLGLNANENSGCATSGSPTRRPMVVQQEAKRGKRGKQFTIIELQQHYQKVIDEERANGKRVRRKIELRPCPPDCKLRNTRECTPDNCPEVERRFGRLIQRALINASNPMIDSEKKPKRLKNTSSFEKSMLYDGILYPDEPFPDVPIFDEIVGDRQIWSIPEIDYRSQELCVSHRVTIFGVRGGKNYILSIVEVFVTRWRLKHEDCRNHKRKYVKRWLHICPVCKRKARKLLLKPVTGKLGLIKGKMMPIQTRVLGRMCGTCLEPVLTKTPKWEYKYLCPACSNIERATQIAWSWFANEKLPECGINVSFLPFEKYGFRVVELTRGNARSMGKIWR